MRAHLAVALLLGATPALAQGKLADLKKGKEFLASCQPDASEAQKAYLAGYVTGSADASLGKFLCPKDPLGTEQLRDVFCAYLKDHPKLQSRPGGLLLGVAFSEKWPCK